jgi:putative hydrolase of the HAD superfamily
LRQWRAIIFDLDDTLYPEKEYVLSGMKAVARWAEKELRFPAEQTFSELREMFETGVRGDTFNRWLSGKSLDAQALTPKMVEAYRLHEPQIQPYDGARQLVERLSAGCDLGLISDGYLQVQMRKWKALRLEEFFKVVIFSDAWGRAAWKPSVKAFEEAIRQFGYEASDMAYVADNPAKDFFPARAVGMKSVRFRREDGVYSHLEPSSPDYAPDCEITCLGALERMC